VIYLEKVAAEGERGKLACDKMMVRQLSADLKAKISGN
jgi:hypothetical protein